MVKIEIPGIGEFEFKHLVCDVNGTLAVDGKLIDGVAEMLTALRVQMEVHLITADTHGKQKTIDEQLQLQAVRLHRGGEAGQKADYVRRLGAVHVAAIGQGANDVAMLQAAGLGVAVLSPEGLAVSTLQSADLVVPNILYALALFQNPMRIVATLRK